MGDIGKYRNKYCELKKENANKFFEIQKIKRTTKSGWIFSVRVIVQIGCPIFSIMFCS